MPDCHSCGQGVSETHTFCPFCGVSDPVPSAPSCPNCAQEVNDAWVKCPMCGENLQSGPQFIEPQTNPQYPTSTPTFTQQTQPQYSPPMTGHTPQQTNQPIFTSAPANQQVILSTSPSKYSQQTYSSPPYSKSSGNSMVWIGAIGAVVVVVGIIIWIVVASAGHSFEWSGDVDPRVTSNGPWYTWSDEDCHEPAYTSYNENGRAKTKGGCGESDSDIDFTMELHSYTEHFDWPNSEMVLDVTINYDSGQVIDANMEYHLYNHIMAGGVWFQVVEYAYLTDKSTNEREYVSAYEMDLDGECIVSVMDDSEWGDPSEFPNWHEAISDVNWPSFCNSVKGY